MKRFNFLIIASFFLATGAQAEMPAYMKVVPATGGFTGGSGLSKSGNIPMLGYTPPTGRLADPTSGLPTGQRQNKPFLIKLQALEAPPFQHALSSKQQLRTVTIFVLKYLPNVKAQIVETYTLEGVSVTQVVPGTPPKSGTGIQYVTVTLNYVKLSVSQTLGPVTAANAWMN